MNTISITTPQNIELEYQLGSLGDRILARIVDWLVLGAYVILLMVLIGFSNFSEFLDKNWWIMLVMVLPVVFYDLACEMLLNGQSIGKKALGIKVISLNGAQPTVVQYLLRWVFRMVDFSLSGSIVALITVAVTAKKQRVGDMVAGTTLVKTRARVKLHDTIYQPIAEAAYEPTYPEVINLRDSDIQLVKEVLQNVRQSGNEALAGRTQQKIESVLHITSRHSHPVDFLQALLADYNHLAAQL